MTTHTIPIAPSQYSLTVNLLDRVFRSDNAAIQVQGKTGSHWVCSMTFIERTEAELRQLDGFLAAVAGMRNRIKFVIPRYESGGAMSAHPLQVLQLAGAAGIGATSIQFTNMLADLTPAFKAGDKFTIGNQLIEIGEDINSDGSGDGPAVACWPPLHKAFSSGQVVEHAAPFGVFLQSGSAQRTRLDEPWASRIQLSLVEDVLA